MFEHSRQVTQTVSLQMLPQASQLMPYVNSLSLFVTLAKNQECCDRGGHLQTGKH